MPIIHLNWLSLDCATLMRRRIARCGQRFRGFRKVVTRGGNPVTAAMHQRPTDCSIALHAYAPSQYLHRRAYPSVALGGVLSCDGRGEIGVPPSPFSTTSSAFVSGAPPSQFGCVGRTCTYDNASMLISVFCVCLLAMTVSTSDFAFLDFINNSL